MGADQKRKEARKRKFGVQPRLANDDPQSAVTALVPDRDASEQQAPAKKQKVKHKMVGNPAAAHVAGDEDAEETTAAAAQRQDEQNGPNHDPAETKNQRFIVFIGNLPFSATNDAIAKHFAKIHPKSIRLRTDKSTGKSKGFAFLEFEAYDRMKTCLKLYHHSTFDDGESPARRLNVELTVGGGGGKSKDRKAKLREKNVKLDEERQRRAAEEEKPTKGQGKKKGPKGVKGGTTEAKGENAAESARPVDQDGDIHPSRRSRMLQM